MGEWGCLLFTVPRFALEQRSNWQKTLYFVTVKLEKIYTSKRIASNLLYLWWEKAGLGNPFHDIVIFLYPRKHRENQSLSNVFMSIEREKWNKMD